MRRNPWIVTRTWKWLGACERRRCEPESVKLMTIDASLGKRGEAIFGLCALVVAVGESYRLDVMYTVLFGLLSPCAYWLVACE